MGGFSRYLAHIIHCAGFLNSRVLYPGVAKQLPHQLMDVQLNRTTCLITGAIRSTPIYWFLFLRNIYPSVICRSEVLLREYRKLQEKLQEKLEFPIQESMQSLRRNRLRSRN
ncbi:hypothetical protein Trydic_g1680 [Trypoxylus dichotomus]